MEKLDKQPVRIPDDFYFFDSLKIALFARTFKKITPLLQFYQSLKTEFDSGSAYIQHQIEGIINNQSYNEKYNIPILDPSVSDVIKETYNDPETFIKQKLSENKAHSWTFYFDSMNDYVFLCNNFSLFFSGKPYDTSSKIFVKPGTYIKFYQAIHDIYFYCSPLKKLIQDKKFLFLLKNINCFSKLSNTKIYEKLTKY